MTTFRNNKFFVLITQDAFWNQHEFIKFLVDNQNTAITIDTNGEGICCTSTGIYRLLELFNYTDVTIFTTNPLESHATYNIVRHSFVRWFSSHANLPDEYYQWNRSKVFGCFYNRPSWYRIGLSSFLYANHLDRSLVNFRANPYSVNQHNYFDLNRLLVNSPESIVDFVKTMPDLPLVVNSTESFNIGQCPASYEQQLKEFYKDFFIEIVAETWTEGQTFFPTEKTSRPINFKKPFIVYGSQDYLCYLRQMGFKTFHDFWDEDYDGYADKLRFKKITQLIDDLSAKPLTELYDMYVGMSSILEHNYQLIKHNNYFKTVTLIVD